ncbi:MAG: multidrug efflux SMR transporter [Phycisphaerales bacterium]|nr:multidrug efflux SMR transporter [Phycisphaerales bacterium]
MGWVYLGIAIIFEVAAALSLKYSESLTKLTPTILMFILYPLCFLAMIKALQYLPLGLMYAVWGGLGTALIALLSWYLFKEPMQGIKVAGIALIVVGVVLANLAKIDPSATSTDTQDEATLQPEPSQG